MRPALKAGLLPVWRDRETVQIGIDPRRAVALTGLGGAAEVLRLLDGSRDREQVLAAARERGIPGPVTERILTLLAAGGVLDDVPVAALRALPHERRRRLAAELAACSLARGHSDAGASALARRDAARVVIHGAGRVAAAIADILLTSGVRQVIVAAPAPRPAGSARARRGAPARNGQPSPATDRQGSPATDRQGSPATDRQGSPVRDRRGGPARDRRGRGPGAPLPDLAILVGFPGGAGSDLPGALMRSGVAHLAVRAEEAIGVVGPLVRPGETACLRCLDLTRAGLDPAWPLILAQLAGRTPEPAACDAALAAAVAAQAAAQALAHLDRGYAARPAENGTLELVLPGWQWRRRTWPRHSACGCVSRGDRPGARQ